MRGKKTTGALAARLAWLNDWLAEDTNMTDALVKVTGGSWVDTREYEERMKLRMQYEHEKIRIESWLSPPKGRPRQNDPRILAALAEWEAKGRTQSSMQLSIKHCGQDNPVAREKFAERVKKAIQRMGLSKPRVRSKTGK